MLSDNFLASAGAMRVRNDRASGTVAVSDNTQFDGNSFTLAPGEISHAGAPGGGGFQNDDMPVTVTATEVPGTILTILCGFSGQERCTGLLAQP